MANTYEWGSLKADSISSPENSELIITTIHYRRVGTNDAGNVSDDTYGLIQLPAPDPNNFIPFNEVDREIIISWLEAELTKVPPMPEEEGKPYDPTTALQKIDMVVEEKLANFVAQEQVVQTDF